ncbi:MULTISPECIES: hypothetical protein [unclassified Nonomuraea]|uniref:hypothetical protein n=1 Tax=unclassified Nonomuraea TaxID=2593643 RepID=UPI0033FFB08C
MEVPAVRGRRHAARAKWCRRSPAERFVLSGVVMGVGGGLGLGGSLGLLGAAARV